MNIFALDHCPIRSARMHCDKHVIKMILEYGQLLSTAHHVLKTPYAHEFYKPSHENHPSAIWTRAAARNYEWLYVCFAELCKIYNEATGKTHATFTKLHPLIAVPPANMPSKPRTPFAQAMPPKYKNRYHPIEAYQAYYCYEKARFAKFTYNPTPDWFTDNYVLPSKRRGGVKATGRLAKMLTTEKK